MPFWKRDTACRRTLHADADARAVCDADPFRASDVGSLDLSMDFSICGSLVGVTTHLHASGGGSCDQTSHLEPSRSQPGRASRHHLCSGYQIQHLTVANLEAKDMFAAIIRSAITDRDRER